MDTKTRGQRLYQRIDNLIEKIFQSKAKSRVYLFLLLNDGATSEEIVKGTQLHPSTVRDILSKLSDQKIITHEKLKTKKIGKNPYLYHAIPVEELLQKHIQELRREVSKAKQLTFLIKSNHQSQNSYQHSRGGK